MSAHLSAAGTRWLAVLAAAMLLPGAAALPAASAASTPTITVNAAAPYRAVTHVAAGGLYALAQPGNPASSLLYPLHLNSVAVAGPAPAPRSA